ncbi:zincin-like metallopeptidase domain-containing protein [Nisaea acidiphila]|uniref:Zincin-like metallopeptidase domain-containing protein n=1 Tax=Nisaea acidiphila TaxID=1862145 RepID=A0A9J7AMM6_9PROT|nr:zincin-like metallopeptidase domain-containing protein [Nisaea acidiphila]UUX48899.1 zincin-like metallopeptidase domain-containing protein [Nisaea acidiphila]
MTDKSPKTDHMQAVTDRIIAALEEGVRPWQKPRDAGEIPEQPLRVTGEAYRGINVIALWMAAQASGYTSPYWMTYRQAGELGGQVRKGEKGAAVFYAGTMNANEEDEAETDEDTRVIRFMRSYTVFNADQIDGLHANFYPAPSEPRPAAERNDTAERYFAATGSDVRHGGNQAFYAYGSAADYIRMPPYETFADAEEYYATLAHEHIHWTKGPGRLERDFGRKKWGDDRYALEELFAELGSAFLGASLGLRPDHLSDHASYIQSWLKVLKDDKRAIFRAASHAQKAVDYLDGFQQAAAMPEAAE